MTHRELLLWLRPQLERAATTGLSREDLRAIRDQLEKVRETSPLQPFASRLYSLVCSHTLLDVQSVAALVAQVRLELAPPRERTVVLAPDAADDDARDKSSP